MKIYTLKRVPYGKKSTPIKDREYSFLGKMPVGTKKEWKAWAKMDGCKVKFKELSIRDKKILKSLK